MNKRVKPQSNANLLPKTNSQADIDGTFAKFKTTEDMRKEIEKMANKLEQQELVAQEQNQSASNTDQNNANASG
jgi:hypothetical protein